MSTIIELADTNIRIKNSKSYAPEVSVNEALDFLTTIWSNTSIHANCYTIVTIYDKASYKHFCLDVYQNYQMLFKSIREHLEKNLKSWIVKGHNVYFQVLPLASKPERGRGSARDVKVGQWLWCDLDYRQPIDRPEFKGCQEGEDHALECYYEYSGRWVHVKRPPLSQVLQQAKGRLGAELTIVVDSGAGYHLYFKLLYELDAGRLQRLGTRLVDLMGGDQQSKDLARVLRLPGSVNPRVGRLVRVIHYEPCAVLDPEELEERLAKSIPSTSKDTTPTSTTKVNTSTTLRELSDTEVLRIVELLKDAYRPGYRQFLVLYLSGWLAKGRISPLSAVKIVKSLYEGTQDTDPMKTRLSAVIYSYKKAGVNVDEYAQEIESLTGVKPYGLERKSKRIR